MLSLRTVAYVLAFAGTVCSAEPTVPDQQVLTTEFAATTEAVVRPGTIKWERRWFIFPTGCIYVGHEIKVLEEIPERAPEDYRFIMDSVRTFGPEAGHGWTSNLSVTIGAFRPRTLPPGPASLKVRVSVTVQCEEQALEKLRQHFGIEELPQVRAD